MSNMLSRHTATLFPTLVLGVLDVTLEESLERFLGHHLLLDELDEILALHSGYILS